PAPEEGASLKNVKWPWFILGFIAIAALFTWVPQLTPYGSQVSQIGSRSLLVALFLIGLSLSTKSIAKVGPRPFIIGVILWVTLATISIPLASWST
ncbi:MAG TPA: putative sulfate exporter family transporter, partial [Kofleriaceae bacterium]